MTNITIQYISAALIVAVAIYFSYGAHTATDAGDVP